MKRGLVILAIASLIGALLFYFIPPSDPLSPLSNSQRNIGQDESRNYIVLGFAPYWNLKKLSPDSLKSITHFAYFNLHLNGDGTIYTHHNRREEEPGYTNYKRLVAGEIDHGTKPLIITFMPESQTALVDMVASGISRQQTIRTILSALQESRAAGVNIDFEPLGETSREVRDNFTLFIQELNTALGVNSEILLTISIYPSAAARPRLWDIAQLSSLTDYFVVMTYDYTMPTDERAGPNAPLRGAGELFEHDIVKNIAELTKQASPKQILLGIPLYGYEWETVDTTRYAQTEGRASVASLERIQKMLEEKTLELVWDRNSLTPYGISTSSGQISQIYFENETSLRLKLEFVKAAGLGGIAIWALGYENNVSWLWPTIVKNLTQTK